MIYLEIRKLNNKVKPSKTIKLKEIKEEGEPWIWE